MLNYLILILGAIAVIGGVFISCFDFGPGLIIAASGGAIFGTSLAQIRG